MMRRQSLLWFSCTKSSFQNWSQMEIKWLWKVSCSETSNKYDCLWPLCVAWSNKPQICFIWFKAACFTLIMNWTGSASHGTFARWRELLGLYLHTKSAAYVRFLNLQAMLVNHFSIGHWPSSNGEYPPSSRLEQWSACCQVHGCRLMEVYLPD